nr:hypothetical protein [Tanacetum cinerariifolium]
MAQQSSQSKGKDRHRYAISSLMDMAYWLSEQISQVTYRRACLMLALERFPSSFVWGHARDFGPERLRPGDIKLFLVAFDS